MSWWRSLLYGGSWYVPRTHYLALTTSLSLSSHLPFPLRHSTCSLFQSSYVLLTAARAHVHNSRALAMHPAVATRTRDSTATEEAATAGFSYGLHQRMFDPLPASSVQRRRVEEVRRYRAPVGDHARARWNPSTQDEAHPFPQRACMHTVGHYDGVEVVDTHFPATVKGTTALRISADPLKKSNVWRTNQSRALATDHHTFRMPAASSALRDEEESRLSYLASVIVEDNTEEKKALRRGWCGSTALTGNWANRHAATAAADCVDYVALNKTKTGLMSAVNESYVTPKQRAETVLGKQSQERALKKAAARVTPLSMHERADAPAVFKISNIDSWWGLDPVEVAAEQTAMKDTLRENPFSDYYASQRL